MSTSRTLIITSGLVGAISLTLRSMLSFSFTESLFFVVPTFNPLFIIINCIIFALAASNSLLSYESDSSATKHYQEDHDDTYFYEHDHHRDEHDHSSDKSANSSFDQCKDEKKFPVRSENKGSHVVSSPENRFPSTKPEKPVGLRRPPTAPVKTFSQDHDTSGDECMEEMWNRVKAEKQRIQPNTWQGQVIPRKNPKKSTASCPSPSRARKLPPSSPSRKKLTERIPSWVKLKKELSMGRDELNSQVEAFITKFKEEMKLQRLESIKRYKLFSRRSDEKS